MFVFKLVNTFIVIQKDLLQQLKGSTVEIAQVFEMVPVVAAQLNDIRGDAISDI